MLKFYNKGEWKSEPHISIYTNGDYFIFYTTAEKCGIEMFKTEELAKEKLSLLLTLHSTQEKHT